MLSAALIERCGLAHLGPCAAKAATCLSVIVFEDIPMNRTSSIVDGMAALRLAGLSAGLLLLSACASPPLPPSQALQAAESAISRDSCITELLCDVSCRLARDGIDDKNLEHC